MSLLGHILGGVGSTIEKKAGRALEAGADAISPASWVANGIQAGVHFVNGDKCQAAASGFRAIPFNPVPAGAEISKLFAGRAKSSDWVGKKTLFHITSVTNANKIDSSKKMRAGSEGVLGGAIYGAESEAACLRKTRSGTSGDYGVIEMEVDLGYCKQVSKSHAEFRLVCDGGMDAKFAQEKGFNSIGCNFNGGQEYGVFDAERVKVCQVSIRRRPRCGSRSRSPRRC